MKSSSRLSWLLMFALIAHHGIIAAPAATYLDFNNEISHGDEQDVKLFREMYASRMKSIMNTSVDPCDNFYEYACGNYANVIEHDDLGLNRGTAEDVIYILFELVNNILERKRDPGEEYNRELQKARQFMNSCVEAKLWPLERSDEYLEVLKKIGGFPAIDPSWNVSNFDWFNMTSHLARYAVEVFVKEDISAKYPFQPYFDISKLGFETNIYLDNIASDPSEALIMKDMLEIYGVTGLKADKVIEDVIEFWREALLAEQTVNDNNDCDDDNPEEFGKWKHYFDIAWGITEFNITEISVCPCPAYYNKLNEIATKRPEAIANYMSLKFLYIMHPRLKSLKFQRLHCIKSVMFYMPILISHFYMKEQYNKDAEPDVYTIISELRANFEKLLKTADWLDEPIRLEALKSLANITTWLGQIQDPITDALIKESIKLNMTNNFAANNLQLSKFVVDIQHYTHLHLDATNEGTQIPDLLVALESNAFYQAFTNDIVLLAGNFHPQTYHPYLPNSVKYGSFGSLFGHELTHGFQSVPIDLNSNVTYAFSLTGKSASVYDELSECFVQHYNRFNVSGLNRKLSETGKKYEVIADSGGLRISLLAYRNVVAKNKNKIDDNLRSSESLPGLNLPSEQLFFVSFAQRFCSVNSASNMWQTLSDEHAVDSYRVLGSLQNLDMFPAAYNCSLGSPMNPEQKCRIW